MEKHNMEMREDLENIVKAQKSKKRLYFFPNWTAANHYTEMLYQASEEYFVEVLPLENPFVIPDDADYVHFHWIQTLWKYSGRGREEFLQFGYMDLFSNWNRIKEKTKFIWSCHDGLSFDEDSYLEIPFINKLVEQVDVIHILSEHTIQLLENQTEFDHSKIMLIPHSSFEGVLNRIDRMESGVKNLLNIPNDAIVIGFLGQIRKYKGVNTLLLAFDKCIDQFPELFLLIGGNNWLPESINFETLSKITNRFLLVDHFLTDSEYSQLASVIDIAVYPYERILNSGSVASSATMGHHIVLPNFPELRFEPALEFVSYFESGSAEDLAFILKELVSSEIYKTSQEKAILYSKNNTPAAMSQMFFTELLSTN
jgi:glycosyltransferase involved in cell wall biosynthesis